jgi:hypothetical protein
VQLQRQPPIRMRQKLTTLRLPQMTTLRLQMIILLPSQLQRTMITRLPMHPHLQHLLQHRLLLKHCQRIQVMQRIRFPLFALRPRSAIYL